ncbi:MAG: VWA domain-containing protein [Legionella sp.]|nr:VWA domain-containing protein [Legionella sp.]
MFELAHPWALACLVLPFLVWYLLKPAKIVLPVALKIPFFNALQTIVHTGKHSLALQKSLWLPALIWLGLAIALAGPRWVGEPTPITRDAYNIMMALDLSGSMEITDMLMDGTPVSRLTVVKQAAEQFVRARSEDKIGLILFGTRAYLQTPLTYDKHSILLRIEDASSGLAGQTTSIGDALGLAVKRLGDVSKKGRIIILLTDGANNSGVLSPLKAAELAQDEHIKVYTIGLGSEGNATDFFIANASADLDEPTLKQIAGKTGGRYFRATDTQSLQEIYKTINKLETVKQEQATIRPQKEYYPWFVAFALLVSMGWLMGKSQWVSKYKVNMQRRGFIT